MQINGHNRKAIQALIDEAKIQVNGSFTGELEVNNEFFVSSITTRTHEYTDLTDPGLLDALAKDCSYGYLTLKKVTVTDGKITKLKVEVTKRRRYKTSDVLLPASQRV